MNPSEYVQMFCERELPEGWWGWGHPGDLQTGPEPENVAPGKKNRM